MFLYKKSSIFFIEFQEPHKLLQPVDKTLKTMAIEFAEYQVITKGSDLYTTFFLSYTTILVLQSCTVQVCKAKIVVYGKNMLCTNQLPLQNLLLHLFCFVSFLLS